MTEGEEKTKLSNTEMCSGSKTNIEDDILSPSVEVPPKVEVREKKPITLVDIETKKKLTESFYDLLSLHINFLIRQGLGLSFIGTGWLELYVPDFLAVELEQPLTFIGIGLGLIAGKKVYEALKDIIEGIM